MNSLAAQAPGRTRRGGSAGLLTNLVLILTLLAPAGGGAATLARDAARRVGPPALGAVIGALAGLFASRPGEAPPAALAIAPQPSFGEVYTWGGSSLTASAVTVGGAPFGGVKALAAGEGYAYLAVRNDGSVWTWPSCCSGPTQVSGLSDVKAVAQGSPNNLALKEDGTVWAWGSGWGYSSTPAQVTGFSGSVTAIASSWHNNVALTSSGAVYWWGDSFSAGSPVSGLGSGATAVGAAWNRGMATKSDGSLVTWGGSYGSTPVTVSGVSGATTLHGGIYHGIGAAGGAATTWDISATPGSGIDDPSVATDVVATEGGTQYTVNDRIALKSDGSVWAWRWWPSFVAPTQMSWVGLTGGRAIAIAEGHGFGGAILDGATIEAASTGTSTDELNDGATSQDPVLTNTGAYTYGHLDLAIAGRGPSPAFRRSYNSADSRVGPLGPGWTHTYNVRLNRPDSTSPDLLLVRADGRTDRYTSSSGSFTPPAGVATTLARQSNGTYLATDPDQTTWTFEAGGRLVAIADRYGNQSALTYNTAGQLTTISDPAGRGSLTLTYNGSGRLTQVADWASTARTVQFGYDGSNRLTSATDREGQVTTYAYDGSSRRLTTITDANGHVAVTNHYDGSGRVTGNETRGA